MTSQADSVTVVFFDDESERSNQADDLRDHTGYHVEFISLDGVDALEKVEEVVRRPNSPDLALVDHYLRKALEVRKGTSIVPLIRERWPGVPVLAVTAAYQDCVKELESEVYDDVIEVAWFGRFVEYAPSIIAGYRQLRSETNDLDRLCFLIGVPDDEFEALRSSLPSSLKMSTTEPTFPHRVFRWFRGVFHIKPGFLLDKAWTALAVGVSADAFDTYAGRLSGALYNGIFADTGTPRWWKSRLYATLLPDSPQRFSTSLCEAAKATLGIKDDEASRCYLCGKKWPEVMGHVDEVSTDEQETKPLHLSCSRVHPCASPLPFYEERRLMLDE